MHVEKNYVKRYLRCIDWQIYIFKVGWTWTCSHYSIKQTHQLFQTITKQGWMNMNMLLSCQWQKYPTNALVNTLDRCRGALWQKRRRFQKCQDQGVKAVSNAVCSTIYPWYRCCTRKFTKNFHFLRRSHQMLDIAFCFASSFPIQKAIEPQHVNVCRTLVFQGFYSSSFLGAQKSDSEIHYNAWVSGCLKTGSSWLNLVWPARRCLGSNKSKWLLWMAGKVEPNPEAILIWQVNAQAGEMQQISSLKSYDSLHQDSLGFKHV